MRSLHVIAVIGGFALVTGLTSCQGQSAPPPPAPGTAGASGGSGAASGASASGSPAAGSAGSAAVTVDACGIGTRALAAATPCAAKADARNWKLTQQAFSSIATTVAQSGRAQSAQVMCAQLVQAIDRDIGKLGCTLDVTAADRAAIDGLLTAWYAQRTPLVPTGDAAADAVLARVAAARDAMCACNDLACLTGVDATLDQLGSLPAGASPKARTLGGALLDDIGRCEARIRGPGR